MTWAVPNPTERKPQYFTRQRFILDVEAMIGTFRPTPEEIESWVRIGARHASQQPGLHGMLAFLHVEEGTKR